jgi:phenylalanyl-tRNA synthetase alpha chain
MIQKLDAIGGQALKDIQAVAALEALEQVRVSVLGKKGALSEVLKGLGSVSNDERPRIGAAANEWKRRIEEALSARKEALETAVLNEQLKTERIDVTMPARRLPAGTLHPITMTARRMVEVLGRLGFDVVTGPEVETDYLNFEAVNIPKDHPARDMQDTFFLSPGVVLRTHTTAIQMRALRAGKPPIRVLCPGAVYRCDDDATHSPMFHQLEGLWVDKGVRMSDLKGTLELFAREMFAGAAGSAGGAAREDARVRLRPSYFQFVEPGAEVDVSCYSCGTAPKAECRICKGTGWLEIMGAGMVHPKLLDMAGIDSREYTGFAFGMGIERIAMLLHGIPDLRLMFRGDSRFLEQFGGEL